MYVLSAAGADEDIPDTMILLSTCWSLWGEIIFTVGVVSDDDDIANEAPVIHQELNKNPAIIVKRTTSTEWLKFHVREYFFHFRWVWYCL